ncbi:pyridoxamine 5'-phosphate oxidase family protein [Microbacterium sp. ZW CA_36]|uniref:pyridoxamine 5'-phosphate oxidase family protein n=1 Tax=Microbacterium sp. ZW CA_36 TaxID=3378078 RepID=UPI003852D4F7
MGRTAAGSALLRTSECWDLLETAAVGRLAVTGSDGMPDIFPVNFVPFEGAVYIRTAPDVKVVSITAHPFAAFEVDGESDEGWWSVVVRGAAALVRDEVEIERSGVGRLMTQSPRHKQHVLKVTATTVSGRRFAHRDAIAPTAPRPVARVADEEPEPPEPPRSDRPDLIPSHPPRT